ncbi:DNA recombination protein RmuC [Candidatus Parcubacteria bacterium]|nr:DNA recombination protein RmuC [Candidatus Parcubacteria bacterium]
MEYVIITLLTILVATVIGGIIWLSKKQGTDTSQNEKLMLLQDELKNIRQEMHGSLEKNLEFVQKQAGYSTKLVQEVTGKLTEIGETNKQVVNFASQMQSLENILKNPKQRGILGEYFLETLLGNILPPNSYKMQYKFRDGEIVDAAIFIKDKIVPVDAKFSLEKYNMIMEEEDATRRDTLEKEFKRDIKNRIDETSKYIRPNEDTTDFAFMFIPAEGVFYSLLIYKVGSTNVNSEDLINYAFKKRVMIVSPTSFFAYLQTVIQGLKALKIEESVKDILERVDKLGKHLVQYQEYMKKVGSNLSTTVNMYNSATKEWGKIDKDVAKLEQGEERLEKLDDVEKPKLS